MPADLDAGNLPNPPSAAPPSSMAVKLMKMDTAR
jgi:hypothetical protein